ncbi:retrovirus-related pol polyprotein from transposon TNT 1-94 [Tanacetum coccineum]
MGTVKFGNDHVAKILGYGDYHIGNVTILRVYYVEGLGHNLFSVGQFCDSNLEVAFRQHTCFIRNLEGVDLLTGSRGNNLYTLSLGDMMASSPICLLSKASKTKSWLWHRRLSHLNFGKSKKKPHKLKSEDTNQEKLYLLHMDLCGPMRVASVNGKKYILVIVDDYSRFTWVKCLRSKDEAPDFIIKFLKMIQVRLKVPVRRIRTDNGAEFVNQTLREYCEKIGISHETSVARSSQRIIETILVDFDELMTMASEHISLEPALHEMTPATISLRLVPNPHPLTPFVPPSRTDWDILFQSLFDELLNPPSSVDRPPEVIAPIAEVVALEPAASRFHRLQTNVDKMTSPKMILSIIFFFVREYLKGGTLSQRYTTSITKTKAADYGQVKWIEDKVPGRIWSPKIVVYDKHAYWGTYYWGPKCQKFNGYAANMETSKDVYLRHMINAVTSLKIMQFFWLQSSGGDYCSKTGRLAIQV